MWGAAFLLLSVTALSVHGGFPYVEPSSGEPWPVVHYRYDSPGYATVDTDNFKFHITMGNCPLMMDAAARQEEIIRKQFARTEAQIKASKEIKHHEEPIVHLESIELKMVFNCDDETYPQIDMKELYTVKICSGEWPIGDALIYGQKLWSSMRGMETFTQLLRQDPVTGEVTIGCTQIMDYPRFKHRGLLLDTSRHYLSIDTLQQNIDLMAMNKFNTFHWHIVDDESFPYESKAYPDLSAEGSWGEGLTYSEADIQGIIDYARDRGIRVVPEFNTPGHVRSWGEGQPGLLTECYENGEPNGEYGPLDPSNEETYVFLTNLFTEISTNFPDKYIHLGGDQVDYSCWASNPSINAFMAEQGIVDYEGLQEYHFSRLLGIIADLPRLTRYIVDEDVFNSVVSVREDTIVQITQNENNPEGYYDQLRSVVAAGMRPILSSCFSLSSLSYQDDWKDLYDCNPTGFGGSDDDNRFVIGGEATMSGETVDDSNIISRIWPRASAVAEKLWGDKDHTLSADDAAARLEEQRCRLLKRGYKVSPIGPSVCH